MSKLEIKEYANWKAKDVDPPPAPRWRRQWHGYYLPPTHDYYTPAMLERFAFLSVLEWYVDKHVNLFELGAGRADWCMALAGAIKYHIVDCPVSYRALAIEAEPTHYRWTKECIESQKINAVAVFGAISDHVGETKFLTHTDPLAHFGQRIAKPSEAGKAVPSYTVDYLREHYKFDVIHIMHMDIQGAEVLAVRGSQKSIAGGKVEHIIISTHHQKHEQELRQILSATHDIVLDLPKLGQLELPNFSKVFVGKGDGFQLWRMKGL